MNRHIYFSDACQWVNITGLAPPQRRQQQQQQRQAARIPQVPLPAYPYGNQATNHFSPIPASTTVTFNQQQQQQGFTHQPYLAPPTPQYDQRFPHGLAVFSRMQPQQPQLQNHHRSLNPQSYLLTPAPTPVQQVTPTEPNPQQEANSLRRSQTSRENGSRNDSSAEPASAPTTKTPPAKRSRGRPSHASKGLVTKREQRRIDAQNRRALRSRSKSAASASNTTLAPTTLPPPPPPVQQQQREPPVASKKVLSFSEPYSFTPAIPEHREEENVFPGYVPGVGYQQPPPLVRHQPQATDAFGLSDERLDRAVRRQFYELESHSDELLASLLEEEYPQEQVQQAPAEEDGDMETILKAFLNDDAGCTFDAEETLVPEQQPAADRDEDGDIAVMAEIMRGLLEENTAAPAVDEAEMEEDPDFDALFGDS